MAFPRTRDGLVEAGYKYENHARCKGCGEEIEWWTTPNGRKIPMNHMQAPHSHALAHFSSCREAPLFRGLSP